LSLELHDYEYLKKEEEATTDALEKKEQALKD